MSGAIVRSIAGTAGAAGVDAAWAQWSTLASAAVPAGRGRVWTLADPEALVLLSLAVRDQEPRVDDLLAAWARAGSFLLSVQRLNTLAASYPQFVRDRIGGFARLAADAGDRRWQRHALDTEDAGPPSRRKDMGPLRLAESPALMLRLRAGFGVGAKADLLTVLLGLGGAPAELRALSVATGYSDRAVRTAAEEMALAGFVHEIQGPPTAYRADPRAWAQTLGTHPRGPAPEHPLGIPPWHYWSVVFAFLADVTAWARAAGQEDWSPYLASSRARDLVERHRKHLRYPGWQVPDSAAARGAAYLEVFAGMVEEASRWTREHLYG